MTGVLGAMAGSGGIIDSQVVTVGYYSAAFTTLYGYDSIVASPTAGSVVDGTFNPIGGATIKSISYNAFTSVLLFAVAGDHAANNEWNSINIAGNIYFRSAATFAHNASYTSWTWTSIATNPFGTTVGATKTVTWS